MKNKLTYSEKMDIIIEAAKSQHIEFKVRLFKNNDDVEDGQAEGYVRMDAIKHSGDFLDVALKLEDMINDFQCLEIVYDEDNKVLWHIDDIKCDPEINDKNFKQFLKFIGWDKVKKC